MTKSFLYYHESRGKVFVKEFENGRRKWVPYEFAPPLFVRSAEKTEFTDIEGHYLEPLEMKDLKSTRDFLRELGEAKRDIYGYWKFSTSFICQADYEDANSSMFKIVYHDIETEVGDGFPDPKEAIMPINMITLIDREMNMYAITSCDVKADVIEKEFGERFNVKVVVCEDERELLEEFVSIWTELDPDMFVGWNSEKFDVPYIVNRIKKTLGNEQLKKLSPFGVVNTRIFIDDFGEEAITADISGVALVDMLHYYQKFVHGSQESYSLDNISKVELGVGKLTHESGIPGHLLYHKYPTDGLRYNIIDVVRLMEIDLKKGVLDLAVIVAQMAKSNLEDVIFSTRLWMNMIYYELQKKNVYFPIHKERNEPRSIEGGYVMDPVIGLHEYIGSFDFASLYPSTMMGLNLGVDTKGPKLPNVNPDALLNGYVPDIPEGHSMGANGQTYRTDRPSFINLIIQEKYAKRKEYKYKKLYYERLETLSDSAIESELKALINSGPT